jgi:hypothetical protein
MREVWHQLHGRSIEKASRGYRRSDVVVIFFLW